MTSIAKHKYFFPSLYLLLSFYYTLPFILRLTWWGGRDWDLFTTIAAVPVGSIIHYGQFPFWNPYLGGGNILFHHPEVAVLSPFMLLYLLFGAVVGLKLQVLICYFVGFTGTHRLGRTLGMSPSAALVTSVAYFGSVHFALHFAEGHMPFTHFCFLPWFLAFLASDIPSVRRAILSALALTLMILGNGAAIPFLYTIVLSAIVIALLAIRDGQLRLIRDWACAIVAALALAAIKFVPMVVYLFQNRWTGNPDESIPISALGAVFFGLKHSLFAQNFPEQFWAWQEYGAYISPLLVILAVAALAGQFRRHYLWGVTALFFILLGLGDFASWSPWAILAHFPGFSSARCTGRAFQFVILSVAVLGGLGLDTVRRRFLSSSWTRYVLTPAAAIIIGTNLAFAWPIMASAFRHPPEPVFRSESFRHVVDKEPQAYKNYLANRGSLVTPWLSAYHPSRGLVDAANNVKTDHILSGRARVTRFRYTPNRITYEINADRAGDIVIGMGYDRGWRAHDGRPLTQTNGLITFPFERGQDKVVLSYRPPYVWAGLILTLLSTVIVILVWRGSIWPGHNRFRQPDTG